MLTAAFHATMQQYRNALARAQAHLQLAHAIKATWPLKLAREELQEAEMFCALARAELERCKKA